MPKVTIYIPLYNREKEIGRAIEGILNQTYTDFELLIIDDGSTDNSLQVVNSFKDKRIRLVRNDKNKGVVYTRNRAFELAKGEYLAINDSDDYSYPERIQLQVDYLDKNKEVGILGGQAKRIYSNNTHDIWKYPCRSEEIKCRLFWGSSMINSTLMMRKDLMQKYNLNYNSNFPVAEDYDLFERAQEYFALRNLDRVCIEYYSHPDNLTNTQQELMNLKAFDINKRQLEKLNIILSPEQMYIWFKVFSYKFSFTKEELVELLSLGIEIISANKKNNFYYNEKLFINELVKKIYNCFYHSKIFGSYILFKKSQLADLMSFSLKERIKFFCTQFIN